WWGKVNIRLSPESSASLREQAVAYLNRSRRLYVIDAVAGWDPRYRVKVRIICARPYHALFMHDMLLRPSPSELAEYGEPDFVILNAGEGEADSNTPGIDSMTSVCLDLARNEMVILGTQYAGEMKKGVFTLMHYLMPRRDVLSMHCAANEGAAGDVSLFFGLSGTGKTTLSADSSRRLIGDDEHCWTDDGVFNVEGGCYAKCIRLSRQQEPQIYEALRFGTVLENVVFDPVTRHVDFDDDSLTENTRAAYPIQYVRRAKIPCVGGHPQHVFLLTCDAFGVLPPVSRLSSPQVMYHFLSGYTAKVAGTEMGVTEPTAAFSACFSAPFLVWHPTRYADLLGHRIRHHRAGAWLINTGWTGGAYGAGERIALRHTRAILDAVHSGALDGVPTVVDPVFGLAVPTQCPGVPSEILQPRSAWYDPAAFDRTAAKLARLFRENFAEYAEHAAPEIVAAGPREMSS
ncbi:MAG: phosphoenolpyruvate carboxykinase (ATP), partial [Planctomycetes bacterium]|nr:phosphoenolpyruvate carboxykinase (ATP) [Planctomycetota bacterium]